MTKYAPSCVLPGKVSVHPHAHGKRPNSFGVRSCFFGIVGFPFLMYAIYVNHELLYQKNIDKSIFVR